MGTHMSNQEKNTQNKGLGRPFILLITGTILTKKPIPMKSSDENNLSFHLEMIKKIDSILEKHEHDMPGHELDHQPPIIPSPPPTPVEPRPPLFKTPDHAEITWQPTHEPPQMPIQIQPEEFKTELSITPEFKFITSQEFINTFLNLRSRPEDRIEIIDLSRFTEGMVLSNKLPGFTIAKSHTKEQSTTSTKKDPITEPRRNKKIEVIDARTLTQKTYEDVFLAATKQTEDIEKKSQIYYLNSKGYKAQKQQKIDATQTYIPIDFDERTKELREKQRIEKEQQQEEEQKTQKQLEREHEKLEKLETKKTKLEEKKHELSQKQKKESKKEPRTSKNELTEKQQQKEQKRLERLEARTAKIEERKRRKEEKQALKEKQKQQHLKQKEKNKKQKTKKEEKNGFNLFKKDKHSPVSTDLDDDIKKVLLMADSLLGDLPEDVINKFMQSEDFELYERVMNKYKIK
jgi:hypothetical protein